MTVPLSQPNDDVRGASVFNHPTLTLRAKVTYGVLMRYADVNGRCTLQHKTLMQEMDVSQTTVVRSLKELSDKGIIKRRQAQTAVHYQLLQ